MAYNKELTSDYKKIGDTFVPFKAVPNGLTDKLLAKVTISDSKINVDSLFFKTQNGVEIKADRIGNDFVLNLKGAQKFAIEEVQATIKQGDKYKIAGVFNLVHVSPKTVNLKLIPTEGVSISANQIKEIKAIYNQLAINIDIEVVPEFGINNYLVGGVLPTEDVFGDLSKYSPAQSKIISDYESTNRTEEAYYIFVTNKPSSTGQSGYMKLNGQFGFVFDQQPATIAHELAHGAFKLEHPFKKFKNKDVSQGTTQSLMDYPPTANFLFTDWKQINDPAFKLYAFQSQSDGEFRELHLTPDWTVFEYKDSKTYANIDGIVRIPNGAVHGISKDGVIYDWVSKDKEYVDINGNKLPNVTIYKNEEIKDDTVIGLFWIRGKCGYNESYTTNWGYIKDKKENFNIDDIKDKNAPIKDLGKVPCIVDQTGIESGSVRYEDKCIGKSIAERNLERIEIETIFSGLSVDKKALAEKINSVDICSLRTLSYDKIKAMIILFSEESSYSNEVQVYVFKLIWTPSCRN